MASRQWLEEALVSLPLTEEVETYLLGRGAKEELIYSEGMKTWMPLAEPSPHPEFSKMFGPRGERLDGMLVVPVWSPSGRLLGFEARSIKEKYIRDFRFEPESKYTAFFIGLRRAMPAIWGGGDIWLGEGVFDLTALDWVVPKRDAVLATVRANLTPQQLEFLRRFCKGRVHVVYDMDPTGRKAVTGWTDEKTGKWRKGVMERLEGVDLKASSVRYEGGKDPGAIWDKGGEPALRAAFAEII